jgi:hypothetical protein
MSQTQPPARPSPSPHSPRATRRGSRFMVARHHGNHHQSCIMHHDHDHEHELPFSKKKVPARGVQEKKKKKGGTYLPTFFEIFLRFSGLILENIFIVFLGSSCRETAKNAIKKKSMGKDDRKKVFFSQLFRPKVFHMNFPQKVFYGVFELPLLRNAQKRHKKN